MWVIGMNANCNHVKKMADKIEKVVENRLQGLVVRGENEEIITQQCVIKNRGRGTAVHIMMTLESSCTHTHTHTHTHTPLSYTHLTLPTLLSV